MPKCMVSLVSSAIVASVGCGRYFLRGYATAGYGGHALGHVLSLAADMTIQMICVAWIVGYCGQCYYM